MGNIKVKYVRSEHKAIFAYVDFARTKLKAIKWTRLWSW